MKRRALLLLLASSGCQHGAHSSPSLGAALLDLAKRAGYATDAELARSQHELEHLAEMAREALTAYAREPAAHVLCELLFGRLGFTREVEDQALDFVFLPGVLAHRRGSCVGLGSLFLALSEALGWCAAGVLMPGHFYVRMQRPGPPCNVELLRRGEAMPDAWYPARFPVPGGTAAEYGRPLSRTEVLGVVEYNLGNAQRRAARLEAARDAYARSVAAFPDFAEAHASLGSVQHLLGRLEPAEASYRLAYQKNPHLPGLDQNLALLEAERRAAAR